MARSFKGIPKGISLVIVTALLLVVGPFQAGLARATTVPAVDLHPFNVTDDLNQNICRYTYDTTLTGHSGLPPLFGNISGVYISATSNFYSPAQREIDMFTPANLALLSACTIVKDAKGRIPIYIPQLSNNPAWRSFLNWPANREDGNLIVRISAELQDERSFHHGISPGKIVIVKAIFYRQDVNSPANSGYQCAQAFLYTTDNKQLQMLLSDSLHLCLDQPLRAAGVR